MKLIPDHIWGILTVWQEARGEPFEGKVAVAEVILRRKEKGYMSDGTVAGTCLKPFQFSGWNTTDPNRLKAAKLDSEDKAVKDCIKAWAEAEAGSNLTLGATHYYNPEVVTPKWASTETYLTTIGRHRFVLAK